MIFDIQTSTVTGETVFVERQFEDACELQELLVDCGFRNTAIGCWDRYDNCIVFIEN